MYIKKSRKCFIFVSNNLGRPFPPFTNKKPRTTYCVTSGCIVAASSTSSSPWTARLYTLETIDTQNNINVTLFNNQKSAARLFYVSKLFFEKRKKRENRRLFFRLDFVCVCVLLPLLLLRIYIDSQWLYYWYTSIHSHFIVAFLYRAVIAGISTAYRFLRVRACIDIGRNFDPVTRNFGFPGVSKCFSVEM
jgi:hypothetical protein